MALGETVEQTPARTPVLFGMNLVSSNCPGSMFRHIKYTEITSYVASTGSLRLDRGDAAELLGCFFCITLITWRTLAGWLHLRVFFMIPVIVYASKQVDPRTIAS